MADDYELLGDTDGETIAQNAEFFAADLRTTEKGIVRVEISVSAAVVIEVTFDSGSNWTALNSDVALGVDELNVFDLFCIRADTLNFRIPTSGGAVTDICRVFQVN